MTGLRERKKQQTRDRLVAEAGRLFAEGGFRATTMEDIAGAAGVSVGTLYNYFGTKTIVLLAHVDAQVGEMMDSGRGVLDDPPGDSMRAVQTLVRIYVDRFISMERDVLRELFAAGFGPVPEVLPELIRLDDLLIDQLGELLEGFTAPGGLAPGIDVAEAVVLLYSLLVTQLIMYVSLDGRGPDSLRRAVDRQIEIAFSGLRGQER